MSVIVKNMEMPKNCAECCMRYGGQGYTWCVVTGESLSVEDMYSKRNEYCPLIELPPHGVLKDTTAFDERIRDQYCKNCERRFGIKNGKRKEVYEIGGVPCRACDIGDMLDWLDDAPTVIEGSET